MIQNDKLFGNLFDDVHITPSRFLVFARNTLSALTVANTAAQFTALIALITPLINAVAAELGDVDTSLNVQKGSTQTNDQVLNSFAQTMSDEEPFIARAVGGKGSPAYLEFYPGGISEYSKATKTTMETLTHRVNVAATAHAAALGATLTATLQAFENSWLTSRNTQEQQKHTVGGNRNERSTALTAAQLGMLTTIHTVAALYPADVEKCSSFFNFNLLFHQAQHPHQNYGGTLAAQATQQLQNRTLRTGAKITATNTDDNAAYIIWLAATPTTAPPAQPVTVQPAESKVLTPADLGNPDATFLLIKNISKVNEGNYNVEVVE